jgi:hypothetical protein
MVCQSGYRVSVCRAFTNKAYPPPNTHPLCERRYLASGLVVLSTVYQCAEKFQLEAYRKAYDTLVLARRARWCVIAWTPPGTVRAAFCWV